LESQRPVLILRRSLLSRYLPEPLVRRERTVPMERRRALERLLQPQDQSESRQVAPTLLRFSHSLFLKEPLGLLALRGLLDHLELTELTELMEALGLPPDSAHLLQPQDQ